MIFETQVINPVTYTPFKFLKHVTGITTKVAYNDIGSFSFSVQADFVEFEKMITTPNGQGQILIYADGKPYIQGVIDSYTPNDYGFIDVECTEILQTLKDDIIVGDYRLTNLIQEYMPEETPNPDEFDMEYYWGPNGSGYFAADTYRDSTNKPHINVIDRGEGITYTADSNGAIGIEQHIFPRWLLDKPQPRYTMRLEGEGFPRRFHWTGEHSWGYKTIRDSIDAENGLYLVSAPIDPSQTVAGGLINVGPYNLIVRARTSSGYSDVATVRIDPYISPLGRKVTPWQMLFSYPFKAKFNYAEDSGSVYIGFSIVFSYDGEDRLYELPTMPVSKSIIPSYRNAQAFMMINHPACRYGLVSFERPQFETHADWLRMVSPDINFNIQQEALEGYSWSLKYTDADRWQIVKKILELGQHATLQYAGIVGGKPTYRVLHLPDLPNLYKFAEAGEIYNARYEKDFSDTYNVLITSAKKEITQGDLTLVTNFNLTIAPSPERPNRLGRLKKKIASASGIEDIETLTQWALALYEEHSSPSEPVSFNAQLSPFWTDITMGQYITIHGLIEGQTITEQVNNIGIDESTGTVSVELAKRLTLQSALIEARLAAE